MQVHERYTPHAMGADASYDVRGPKMGGFICTVSGTLSVTDVDGTTLVDAVPVTAGTMLPIPINFKSAQGGTVQLAGSAEGTLLV